MKSINDIDIEIYTFFQYVSCMYLWNIFNDWF